jgi:crotonobetainyl-CoA:carnitine CoA-transferase CaiB-like acyl-CoA transferase
MERAETGRGKRIDVSMAQGAVSWLHTFLPMLDMGSPPGELKRSGNEHRQFIPVNAYPTRDGFIYMAIGGDAQWGRFVAQPMFGSLAQERFSTNEGRRRDKVELHRLIGELTRQHLAEEVARVLAAATIPNAPITPIEKVPDLPFVAKELLHTVAPDGRTVRLPPPAVPTEWLAEQGGALRFSPRYGEHTDALLAEIGLPAGEIAALRAKGAVA